MESGLLFGFGSCGSGRQVPSNGLALGLALGLGTAANPDVITNDMQKVSAMRMSKLALIDYQCNRIGAEMRYRLGP
jgi:hypothetical protein